jgi:hypothetical protein
VFNSPAVIRPARYDANARVTRVVFVHELQAEVHDARVAPGIHVEARFLSLGAEDRVTAANVGDNGMLSTALVFDRDLMLLARTTAVLERRARRKESAEDTVLGVEDRQVLIRDGLQTCTAHLVSQRGDLVCVEVVARCDALQSEVQKRIGAQRIRNVETEVAGQSGMRSVAERIHQSGRSDQQRAIETQQEVDNSLLTRLEHSRACNSHCDA